MSKKTWADVKKLDVVELGGRAWTVTEIKAGKKKADVTVEMGKRSASSTVALSDRVKITGRAKVAPSAVMDEHGTQQRWAKESELREALGEKKGLAAGDASKTKPPAKAKGRAWDEIVKDPSGAEKRMHDLLSARLVGESNDESAGYYVPPIDVSTVAAHLALFHDGAGLDLDGERAMLDQHAARHAAALDGALLLPVNHWHTAKRP